MPPSVNGLFATDFRTKRRFKSKQYTTWLNEVAPLAYSPANRMRFKSGDEVRAIYLLGKPDKRRRDVANSEKAISDLLVSWGVLEDDCQIVDIRLAWSGDVEPGMVKVTLEPLNPPADTRTPGQAS